MGRKKVFPPIVRIHKGRERVSHNRVWYDLGPAGSPETKLKYAQLVLQWQTDPQSSHLNADDYLVAELFADYLEKEQARCSKVRRIAANLFAERYGVMPVRDMKARHFEEFKRWLCEAKNERGNQRFGIGSIRLLLGAVRAVWEWGVIWGLTTPEQVIEFKVVKNPVQGEARCRRVVKPAPRDALEKLLPHVSLTMGGLLRLIAATGMRPSEAITLTPSQITRGGITDVPGRGMEDLGDIWMVTFTAHKTAMKTGAKYLLLTAEARAILEPLWDLREPDEPFFHLKTRKKPYTVGGIRNALLRACKKAGMPYIHVYRFRHLRAVLLDEQHGREVARAVLGHTSEHMTSHYTGRNFAAAKKAAGE